MLVEIGYVARPHGLRGEVVVVLTTDRDERVAPGAQLVAEQGLLVVRSARGQRGGVRSGERSGWIVQFEGCEDRDAAEALRGQVLRAEPIDDPDELWARDVVGADVVVLGGDEPVGRCVALVANPAADLLELDTGALVPVVFVVDVEPADEAAGTAARVVIDPPPGLFEL